MVCVFISRYAKPLTETILIHLTGTKSMNKGKQNKNLMAVFNVSIWVETVRSEILPTQFYYCRYLINSSFYVEAILVVPVYK